MSEKEQSHERRKPFTDEEIEDIKAQLLDSIYADIGKSVVKKILWLVGALVTGALGALTIDWSKIEFLKHFKG